ncbi:MAG TPA: BPL-N domain-containing protein, partial [Bacteroidales bacterium]|nr:BPL-N domain-containing protein [Bacteroidales bacterium]
MKLSNWPIFLALLLFIQCTSATQTDKMRVAVFDGHGGAQTCIWEAVAAIKLDAQMEVRTITSADIANNVLDSLDAIIIPGGGGSRQYLNLGNENQRRIKVFVARGGGAVGICAGAYLFSDTPEYSCMQLNGAQAIDIEHDNRGHGMAKFTLTEEGKEFFPEVAERDTLYVMYYEGPVFVPREGADIQYETLAIMESDVHEQGDAPKNMTNNKPFFIGNKYGEGRVFSCIAHPEATPGMMWMIPRMVRWTLDKPIAGYAENVIDPTIFNKEILMSIAD